MAELPPTSYVRMVDIWLIFGIIIPFLEVAILTFKEFNNIEEEQEINHHGHARKVFIPQEIDVSDTNEKDISSDIYNHQVTAVQPLSVDMKIDNYISKEETKISKKALIKYASLIGEGFYVTVFYLLQHLYFRTKDHSRNDPCMHHHLLVYRTPCLQ